MKKILVTLIIAVMASVQLSAQSCHGLEASSATDEFADLGKDVAFVGKHLDPVKFTFKGKGKVIAYPVEGGDPAKAYYLKATDKKSDKYLFVIHEWWGLNDHIKQEVHDWHKRLGGAVHVMALDLYDNKVADTKEKASEYMQSVKTERAQAIIEGALQRIGDQAKVATIGWCFGGGWSLQTALIADEQTVGCVMYYGMPEKDVEKLKTLNTDVLAVFAKQDQWINATVAAEFEKNMKAASKGLELLTYDAQHAFANPSNPVYDKEAADKANAKALDYLKKHFGM